MTALAIPAAALVTLAAPAADSPLAALEREIEALSPDVALLKLPVESPATDPRRLARALDQLEAALRRDLAEIDARRDLFTNPALREERSDLAVRDLRLRIPAARARLIALDPAATAESVRAQRDILEPLDWAWGDAAEARRVALAALAFRAGRFQAALSRAKEASPADPLARDLRLAARAALSELDPPPIAPRSLRLAIAGAARHSPARAAALARDTLLSAPAATVEPAREATLTTLAEVAPPAAAPLAELAAAARARDAETLARLSGSPDDLLAAEAHLALAGLGPPAIHLARALERHPNPAARRAAAGRITPHVRALPDDRRLAIARLLLADFTDHPHADRWRLDLAAVAPPADALATIDRIADPELAAPAALLAARRAHDAFAAEPSESSAERLSRRLRAAETAGAPAAWRPWLLRAETEARLAVDDLTGAADRLLSAPAPDAAPAASLLAPKLLDRALAAEAAGDQHAQRESAALAARILEIADAPARRALALALAGQPEAALAAAAEAPAPSLARAEALFALERDAEAFAIYRNLATAAEAQDDHGETFWRAWSRMLEIIARQDPARRDEIAREIRRLRIIDPGLGGDPHRRRFTSLLDSESESAPATDAPE